MPSLRNQQLVVVGLSGGVDSAVTAFFLQKEGYHVEAVFMQNWQESQEGNCSLLQDLNDARLICETLKIKLHTVDFSAEYWQRVFQIFLDEYVAGRTPNPDVLCNKEIKFRAFLDYAKSLGADFIATGHYARRETLGDKVLLLKGLDKEKDQSYFLYLLNQKQLASVLFPLGDLTKKRVRKIAEEIGLHNHAKKDSTGICFIGERRFKDFLGQYLLARPGDIVTRDGTKVGRHEGLMFYTIGQRKGIGIGGQSEAIEAPWYVAAKDQQNNFLIVAQKKDDPGLLSKELICEKIHWISGNSPRMPLTCSAKVRYRQEDQSCRVQMVDTNRLHVSFTDPQWAITPGQSVVFYDLDLCLGGGVIL